ncbi:exopolyphosphatase / guanosine-5'-triphosphate,3'-diphosphate pyrophosphatase [Oceanicella actignis]|uniref:Exopolyphosphatase / guanosine-5'-triphosphate,3'-diphosphate pyrophosphatase n=2 Tax=Oceanicella actignis TaxID=1189325 RepID=A0A1M7SGV6_9RHOB|nr:Ppx/GppA phosphatase family protein [Oceanicella actignis]TYO91249.1 exopolyphosphatase/guanosine-5'-triphosphate,3'-diphosphate pyrophosphatase [Oceanicella actignis]SET20621.1 exopolyphosphatase / guanosine-5'-triphosphate,3'-diphosphate pyrophosphatase [Oceanicella actignis]SHN57715.1 exopolyphosphatase / guanosine-5'-triphosphate,3'-diphosphate pyrophosphatase [Oceanicella actignis]
MASSRGAAPAATRAARGDARAAHDRDRPCYAALDLGTNNCRLLVARPAGAHFDVIDAFSRNVRLGEGVERTGALCDAAMNRTIDALRICAAKIRRHEVRRARVIATEACRRAINGRAFLRRVRRETGLEMELITPEQEARLALAGCAPLLDPEARSLMVFDIGGGSTELIWVDLEGLDPAERQNLLMALAPGPGGKRRSALRREARARVVDWISAPVGVATLHDKFADVRDDRSRYALMSWFFEENLAGFIPYEDPALQRRLPGLQIIGASGTVTTLGALHKGLVRYDRAKVDGMWLGAEDAVRLINALVDMGPAGRRAHPGVGHDRAELVVAGGAILRTILRLWPAPRIRVADRGLREGLLYSQMWTERMGDA